VNEGTQRSCTRVRADRYRNPEDGLAPCKCTLPKLPAAALSGGT
jgi:hypothetical protein